MKETFKPSWFSATIPFNMARGTAGILTTLLALSLGASVTEIGILLGANAIARIIFSMVWGKLSDSTGMRKSFLLIIFLALSPIFILLSLAQTIFQLILIYSLLAIFTSGFSPIAIMFAVESWQNKRWEGAVARYNSISRIGDILGLVMNAIITLHFKVNWLFYISSALCLIAFILLWRLASEPRLTLERHAFPFRSFQDAKETLSSKTIVQFLDIRRFRIPKINLFNLKPLQLFFLACFVHWVGINCFVVGETPLLKELGMSDSFILAINAINSFVMVLAFGKVIPSLRQSRNRLIRTAIFWRGAFIFGWAGISLLLVYPSPYVFLFPILLRILWPLGFAMIWLSISTYAISAAPATQKGATQGALSSTIAVASALGSILGGFMISTFGFTVGFVLAAIIFLLAIPLFLLRSQIYVNSKIPLLLLFGTLLQDK